MNKGHLVKRTNMGNIKRCHYTYTATSTGQNQEVALRYAYDEAEEPIKGFFGSLRFLSNFYPCEVPLFGEVFPSSEHAFMFFKSNDIDYRLAILEAPTPKDAKALGRRIKLRPDWDEIKFRVMLTVVGRKFSHNRDLRDKLLKTNLAYLEETNSWGDRIWGVCNGKGQNHLGCILMAVRYQQAIVVGKR